MSEATQAPHTICMYAGLTPNLVTPNLAGVKWLALENAKLAAACIGRVAAADARRLCATACW